MNTNRSFSIGFLCILLWVSSGNAESFEILQLPSSAAVTGVAFSTDSTGLITVDDTLVYHIQSPPGTPVTFYEQATVGVQNDFPNYHPVNDYVTAPVWASDSTIVMIREATGSASHQEILGSRDRGVSWALLTPVWHPDLLYQILAVPQTWVYCIYLTDIYGEPAITRRLATTLQYPAPASSRLDTMPHPPLTGVAAAVTSEHLLLASTSDSLVEFNYVADTVTMWLPQLEQETLSGNFLTLYSNAQEMVLGRYGDQTLRSTDAGRTWSPVTPQHNFTAIDWTWSNAVYSQWRDSLWYSLDAGSTWTNTGIHFPPDMQVWDVVADRWLWVGGDSGRVYRQNLQYPDQITGPAQNVPRSIALHAYPNPFNASTLLRFELSQAAAVRLRVVNVRGKQVWAQTFRRQPAGSYSIPWAGINQAGATVASGIYFVLLEVNGRLRGQTKVILLQ